MRRKAAQSRVPTSARYSVWHYAAHKSVEAFHGFTDTHPSAFIASYPRVLSSPHHVLFWCDKAGEIAKQLTM